jgi:hypothetical protein
MDKDFYNSSSSKKLGWLPSWFGCNYFDDELVKAVKKWQRKNNLKADGLVGPMTYRRVWTEREDEISNYQPTSRCPHARKKYIVHNGNFIPIKWDKVILWDEDDGLKSKKGCYTDLSGKDDRDPTFFVNHWDVCLSAESCSSVLNRRGISVHFCIDNDGTIYQLLDTQHKAFHAGSANSKSIGVEISNAYYTKYQSWYERNGFGPRPIKENAKVHGVKLPKFLDFYPVQLEALKALWLAIHEGIGIPLEYPETSSGDFDMGVNSDCKRNKFKGFCNHYNISRRKLDCAGLDIPSLLEDIK